MTRPDLYEAISLFNANDLSAILVEAGQSSPPKNKEGKVRLWMELIGQPERIHRAYERLNERARRALEQLQLAGGEMRTTRFRSLLSDAGIIARQSPRPPRTIWSTISRPETSRQPRDFSEILAHLLLHGMIWTYGQPAAFTTATRLNFEGGRYVYIPDEVARHLPPPSAAEPSASPSIGYVLSGSARVCQRDLYLMWSAARETPFSLTNNDLLRVTDLKRVAGQLLTAETVASGQRETHYRRLFFLRRLLTAQGLLNRVPNTDKLAADPQPTFFGQTAVARVRASFNAWRDGAWWNELWTTYVQGSTRASGSSTDFAPRAIVLARQYVMAVLVELIRQRQASAQEPAGEPWIALDALDAYLHYRGEDFLIDREMAETQTRYYYYGNESASPYVLNELGWTWADFAQDEDAGWRGVERTFLKAVLSEGLYWLGLIDLGYEQPVTPAGGTVPDGWSAVRLTDMGRWLLLDGPEPTIPEETGRVVLQPNFHVFAFDPISDSVLARLDSFATRLNAERAVEFEITRDSVYRSQLAGQSVAVIKEWLEQITGSPLPQNVGRSLDEWHAAFERIVVWPRVAWLEVAEPDAAAALLADPALRPHIIKQVTPTGLLVHRDRAAELEQALFKAGELPERADNAMRVHRASLELTETGRITLIGPLPWLYTRAALERIAEQTAEGWQITPGSVARAAAQGRDAASILADLTYMAANGVPEQLVVSIKRWARHYGKATFEPAILVQFRDQDALNDLRQDGVLRRLLKPLRSAASDGLAKIDPADLERVTALLRERGVEIEATPTGPPAQG
ncbi:MAG: hypothetical protein BWY52_00440 [Chloroflexi bacterium ADurb.Bin325]|nr:MAG: hypothetical protein BWY52_00440 [Chloroflexi bacterium ADurb.Bin325]